LFSTKTDINMKRFILFLCILFSNVVLAFVPIKISADFTDKQVREAEKRAFDEFGVKVEVEVLSRKLRFLDFIKMERWLLLAALIYLRN
jgi:hypothetical protein